MGAPLDLLYLMRNKERFFIQALQELSNDMHLEMKVTFGGWIISLTNKDGLTKRILGYTFPINDAATSGIFKDKAALSALLAEEHIPHVHHELLLSPEHTWFLGKDGNKSTLDNFTNKHPFPLVLKPNAGTSGDDIYLVHKQWELEHTLLQLFHTTRAVAICPFEQIDFEYRVIVLRGQVLLVFGKQAPRDGWQHNLSKGGTTFDITDEKVIAELHDLAVSAMTTVGAYLGAVDIVHTPDGLKIIEINGGISLEKVSHLLHDGALRCTAVYRSIIKDLFT